MIPLWKSSIKLPVELQPGLEPRCGPLGHQVAFFDTRWSYPLELGMQSYPWGYPWIHKACLGLW